jgi:hypothetical protein
MEIEDSDTGSDEGNVQLLEVYLRQSVHHAVAVANSHRA